MNRKLIFLLPLFLCSCVSYYDEYEQDFAVYQGYNMYNAPLRVRPLTVNDWYMIDHQPQDYFNVQMWSAISDVSRYSIHSFFRNLPR